MGFFADEDGDLAPAQQGERKRHIGMLMAATENDMEWQNLVKVPPLCSTEYVDT
jgi:hypothetical protein